MCKKKIFVFLLENFQRQAFIPKYCGKQTLKIPGIAIYLEQFQMRLCTYTIRLINLVSLGECISLSIYLYIYVCTHERVSFFAYNFHKSCVNTFNKGDNFSFFKFMDILCSGESDENKCDVSWTDRIYIMNNVLKYETRMSKIDCIMLRLKHGCELIEFRSFPYCFENGIIPSRSYTIINYKLNYLISPINNIENLIFPSGL